MNNRQKNKRLSDLEKLEKNDKISFCYIRKRGTYYRPNSCGYTEYLTEAGVYTKEEAIEEARFCEEIDAIPIDIIAHNLRIMKQIKSLTGKLIL